MRAASDIHTPAGLAAVLAAALAAGTRDALTSLMTEDVRWGGERRGEGNECTDRQQVGDHYAGLLAAGVTLRVDDLRQVDADGDVFDATMLVTSPDPDDFPPQMAVRLTLRAGLVCDICILDNPATIEVLYFDGCPHHDAFLPHLRELLAEHGITAPVTLTRIEDDADARAHRFLGSPTLRVNGHDVEPGVAEQQSGGADASQYGLQCRLYATPDGTTGTPADQWILDALVDNAIHEAAIAAVRAGDVTALRGLLADNTGLAATRLARHEGRTLLHIATDWPGHFPNVAATIAALVEAGADPNTGCLGEHPETPLHWAASSDDLAAIDALLDAGADIDAPGAVIAGGTPMADATAFGQWAAARRLLERGASTNLFEASTLGLVEQVERRLAADRPTAEDLTSSFWGACHGGQVDTAAVLLAHGADINWVGYDELTPLGAARRADAPAVVEWLEQRGAISNEPDA